MKVLVEGCGHTQLLTTNPQRIMLRRGRLDPVVTKVQDKVMSFTYSKRCIVLSNDQCIDTLPFGHFNLSQINPVCTFKPAHVIRQNVDEYRILPSCELNDDSSNPVEVQDWFHTPAFDELLSNRNYVHFNDVEQLSYIDSLLSQLQ